MSEEIKKETAPTNADAPTNQEEPKPQEEPKETPEGESKEPQEEGAEGEEGSKKDTEPLNYKDLLEQEKTKREKAEKALARERYLAKHGKPMPKDGDPEQEPDKPKPKEEDEPTEDFDDDEDKPLTMKQWRELEAKKAKDAQKTQEIIRAKDLIQDYTEDQSEADYMLDIFSNREFPSYMTTEEKVEEAWLLANKGRIISENKELIRALKNKDNVNRSAPVAYRKKQTDTTEPRLSDQDKKIYAQSGFVYNAESRKYEKVLPNGDTLVKDHKTGKQWIQKKK